MLTDGFNAIVKGVEIFVNILTKTIKLVADLTAPIFLLTRAFSFVLIPVAGLATALLTLTVAIKAFKLIAAQKGYLVDLAAGLFGVKAGADASTASLIRLTAVKMVATIKSFARAVIAFGYVLVRMRGNLAAAGAEMVRIDAMAGTARVALLAKAGAIAAVVAALAVLAYGVKLASDEYNRGQKVIENYVKTLKSLRAEIKGAAQEARDSRSWLEKSTRTFLDYFSFLDSLASVGPWNSIEELQITLKSLSNSFKEAGANIALYNTYQKLNEEDLISLTRRTKTLVKAMKERLEQVKEEKENARAEGFNKTLDALEAEERLLKKNIKKYEDINKVLQINVERRNLNAEAIDNQVASLKELNEQLAIRDEKAKTVFLLMENSLRKQLGETVEGQVEKELALERAREQYHRSEIIRLKDEIKALKQLDPLRVPGGEKEQEKMLRTLSTRLLQQESAALESAKKVADGINAEIKRVFDEAIKESDVYAQISAKVASKVNQIRQSSSTALSTLRSLADQIFASMRQSAGPNVTRQKQIEETRLKFQVRINRIEEQIARTRLETEYRLAQLEAQRIKARLKFEAGQARRAGDTQGARSLELEAGNMDNVMKLNEANYEIGKEQLNLERKLNDEKVRQEALSSDILGTGQKVFTQSTNRVIQEQDINRELGLQKTNLNDIYESEKRIRDLSKEIDQFDQGAIQSSENASTVQAEGIRVAAEQADILKGFLEENVDNAHLLQESFSQIEEFIKGSASEAKTFLGYMVWLKKTVDQVKDSLSGGTEARWMGGPVQSGQTYRVNDAGLGREAFMNKFGDVKMLPAGSNINWTAPSSGTIIPARIVKEMQKNVDINANIRQVKRAEAPRLSTAGGSVGANSGNLVKQMTAAMSASGGNQRITNNVTIQSQQPVTDASQIMTNVARMRLRNSRRI